MYVKISAVLLLGILGTLWWERFRDNLAHNKLAPLQTRPMDTGTGISRLCDSSSTSLLFHTFKTTSAVT